MKDLNDNFSIQAFIIGLINEHVRYAQIHGDISTMHKLMAHAQKFTKANKMRLPLSQNPTIRVEKVKA